MLLSQIPHGQKKKIATEFKFDLKVLGASRKAETEDEDNRFTRLEAVTAFVREYGNVGSVDEPDEYIEGELLMRWGPYINLYHSEGAPLVYFGGSTDQTIVGLGGSSKHVIGNEGQSQAHSHSITPYLISYLQEQLGLSSGPKLDYRSQQVVEIVNFGVPFTDQEREAQPLHAVYLATDQMQGPEQRLEFLAKKLLYGSYPRSEKQILLGTPIYVAMVE